MSVVAGAFLIAGSDAVMHRVQGAPRIAFLGPLLNYEETHGLVRSLTTSHPDIGLIVVREQRSDLEDWVDELPLHAVLSPSASDETTLELVRRLTDWLVDNGKANADDFAPTPAPLEEKKDDEVTAAVDPEPGDEDDESIDGTPEPSLPEEAWEFPPLEAGQASEAIAVVAPKGGQGKTTLAVNLATGLAEVAPNSVVLVDADMQFGDIATALSLELERTIVDAVSDAAADEIVFKTSLIRHDDGFFVVASAPSPELGDSIPAAALGQLIERLRESFRYVIVDTTPGLGEHTLVVLEHVTDAVFVTNMSVPSLRAMRTEFDLLTRIGLMPANRHLVLNQIDKLSGLTVRDAERIIGAPIDAGIPRSSAVLLASNRGVPLIHDDVRDPAAKAVRSVVMRIAPAAYPKRRGIQRRRRSD